MEEWNTLVLLLDYEHDLGFGFKVGNSMIKFLVDELRLHFASMSEK